MGLAHEGAEQRTSEAADPEATQVAGIPSQPGHAQQDGPVRQPGSDQFDHSRQGSGQFEPGANGFGPDQHDLAGADGGRRGSGQFEQLGQDQFGHEQQYDRADDHAVGQGSGAYEQDHGRYADEFESTQASMPAVDDHFDAGYDDGYDADYDQHPDQRHSQPAYDTGADDGYGHDDPDATRVAPMASYDDLYASEGNAAAGHDEVEAHQFGDSPYGDSHWGESGHSGEFDHSAQNAAYDDPVYPEHHADPSQAHDDSSAYDNLFADSYYGDQSGQAHEQGYDQGYGQAYEQGYDEHGYLDHTSVDQQPVGPHTPPPPPMAPQMGYDGFAGYDGYQQQYAAPDQEKGSSTKRWAIIGAVAAAVVAIAAFGIGMLSSGGDDSAQTAGSTGSSAGASPSAGSGDDAKAQATKLSKLIKASAKDKAAIGTAVDQIQGCTNMDQAITTFQSAASSRKQLAQQAGALDVSAVSGGSTVVQNLQEAWTKAGQADSEYAAWGKARHGKPGACKGGNKRFKQASQLSDASHPAKQAAAKAWNPIAKKYDLDTVEWTKL